MINLLILQFVLEQPIYSQYSCFSKERDDNEPDSKSTEISGSISTSADIKGEKELERRNCFQLHRYLPSLFLRIPMDLQAAKVCFLFLI